jgi:hypothetical protein
VWFILPVFAGNSYCVSLLSIVPTLPKKPVLEKLRRLLCSLQDHIRDEIAASRKQHSRHFAEIASVTKADTIYQVDKVSERAIFSWFEKHWPKNLPVQLVMEGVEDDEEVTFPAGTPLADTAWKCILDPIDGTRCLMYDKRSAWSLGAIAPQCSTATRLNDIVVAAMTELPTTKQIRSDQFSAWRGGKLIARAKFLGEKETRPLSIRPSQAKDFKHGFASFVRFFPEGRLLTSQIEEEIWSTLYPNEPGNSPIIFDDQYISTGGQLHELLSGRDRLVADIRPLVLKKLGLDSALVCHPYDICTALLLEAAGGVVEMPNGEPLDAPLDTTSPVAWVGYANPTLAKSLRPVLQQVLKRRLK